MRFLTNEWITDSWVQQQVTPQLLFYSPAWCMLFLSHQFLLSLSPSVPSLCVSLPIKSCLTAGQQFLVKNLLIWSKAYPILGKYSCLCSSYPPAGNIYIHTHTLTHIYICTHTHTQTHTCIAVQMVPLTGSDGKTPGFRAHAENAWYKSLSGKSSAK